MRASSAAPLSAADSRAYAVARGLRSVATTVLLWSSASSACTPEPVPRSSVRPTTSRGVAAASVRLAAPTPSTCSACDAVGRPARVVRHEHLDAAVHAPAAGGPRRDAVAVRHEPGLAGRRRACACLRSTAVAEHEQPGQHLERRAAVAVRRSSGASSSRSRCVRAVAPSRSSSAAADQPAVCSAAHTSGASAQQGLGVGQRVRTGAVTARDATDRPDAAPRPTVREGRRRAERGVRRVRQTGSGPCRARDASAMSTAPETLRLLLIVTAATMPAIASAAMTKRGRRGWRRRRCRTARRSAR